MVEENTTPPTESTQSVAEEQEDEGMMDLPAENAESFEAFAISETARIWLVLEFGVADTHEYDQNSIYTTESSESKTIHFDRDSDSTVKRRLKLFLTIYQHDTLQCTTQYALRDGSIY